MRLDMSGILLSVRCVPGYRQSRSVLRGGDSSTAGFGANLAMMRPTRLSAMTMRISISAPAQARSTRPLAGMPGLVMSYWTYTEQRGQRIHHRRSATGQRVDVDQ